MIFWSFGPLPEILMLSLQKESKGLNFNDNPFPPSFQGTLQNPHPLVISLVIQP
jgi:hypothetical protein